MTIDIDYKWHNPEDVTVVSPREIQPEQDATEKKTAKVEHPTGVKLALGALTTASLVGATAGVLTFHAIQQESSKQGAALAMGVAGFLMGFAGHYAEEFRYQNAVTHSGEYGCD